MNNSDYKQLYRAYIVQLFNVSSDHNIVTFKTKVPPRNV